MLVIHQTVNCVLYDNCKDLTSVPSYLHSNKSDLVASLNYSHETGIGYEGFWIQGNTLGLGLFLEKLSDEKASYFTATKMHNTHTSTAELGCSGILKYCQKLNITISEEKLI
jgi:hypothetical protein